MKSDLRRICAAILSLVLASSSAFGAKEQPIKLPDKGDKWLGLRMEGFSLFSCADPRGTSKVATSLKTMRDAFGALTSIRVEAAQPVKVFLFETKNSFFASSTEFERYRDHIFGRHAELIAGFFMWRGDSSYVVLDGDNRDSLNLTVYHELTHFLVAQNAPTAPLWFNEGVAEFYSTFEDTGSQVKLGRPRSDSVLTLRDHSRLPLARLLRVTSTSQEYIDPGLAQTFYAESWALVHYLLIGQPERKGQLHQFLLQLKNGRDIDTAFPIAFGCDVSTLEDELVKYIGRAMLSYLVFDTSVLSKGTVPQPAPVAYDVILGELGELLGSCSSCDRSDARRFFMAALAVNGENAQARSQLDRLDAKETQVAVKVRLPVSNVPDSTRTDQPGKASQSVVTPAFAAAQNTLDELSRSRATDNETQTKLRQVRDVFRAAVDSFPNSTLALNCLARTYDFEGQDHAAGITACEKSLFLDVNQPDAIALIVSLYLESGQREKACEVRTRLVPRCSDSYLAGRVEDRIAIWDCREGRRLIKEGQFEEGFALIDRTIQAITSSALKDQLQYQRDEALQELEDTLYDSAVKKVDAKDYRGALAIIDQLLKVATDTDVLARSHRLKGNLILAIGTPTPSPTVKSIKKSKSSG